MLGLRSCQRLDPIPEAKTARTLRPRGLVRRSWTPRAPAQAARPSGVHEQAVGSCVWKKGGRSRVSPARTNVGGKKDRERKIDT